MPITVNIEDIPLLREPFERARAEARAKGFAEGLALVLLAAIEQLLRQKFPSDVRAGLVEHLAKLPPESLDEMIDNCATALSVSDAVGRSAPKG